MKYMCNIENDEEILTVSNQDDEITNYSGIEIKERPFIEFIDSAEEEQDNDGFTVVFAFFFAILGAIFVGTGLVIFFFAPNLTVPAVENLRESILWNPLVGAFVGAVIGALFGFILDVFAFISRTKKSSSTKSQTTV